MSKYIVAAINREQLIAAHRSVASWGRAVFGTMDGAQLAGLTTIPGDAVPVYFYEPG